MDYQQLASLAIDLATAVALALLALGQRAEPQSRVGSRRPHKHVWPEQPLSVEETNKQRVGVFQCLTCGEYGRFVLENRDG